MAQYLKPDFCIIGAGAGGLAAARAARMLGASVILIERGRIGGDLNLGSIPSKALIASGRRAHALRTASQFGIGNDVPKPNFRAVQEQVQQVIDALAPDESAERLQALGIELIAAEASFIDRRTIKAGEALIRARRFVIATGSKPLVPEIEGLADVPYFTSDTIFANAKKLTHLVIIGGGPLGIELAQAFRRLGSAVSVVEQGMALAQSDAELRAVALRQMREEDVAIFEQTRVDAIIARSQGIGIRIVGADGGVQSLDASHILLATGRMANFQALQPGRAGISLARTDPLRLALTRRLRTSNRRVYAIGDATGGDGQVLPAAQQGRDVINRLLLGSAGASKLHPRAVFSDPEIAETGMTEEQARQRYKDRFRVVRASFADNHRARTTRQTYGVAKLICAPDGRIVGAGIVGPEAGELIAMFTLAIANRLTAKDLRDFAAPYPALSDIAHQLGLAFFADASPGWWTRMRLALLRILP